MTIKEFQLKHWKSWFDFLQTECGRDFVIALQRACPPLLPLQQEHLLIENSGAVRGYGQSVKNIYTMATPPAMINEPEQNYGVKINEPTSNA